MSLPPPPPGYTQTDATAPAPSYAQYPSTTIDCNNNNNELQWIPAPQYASNASAAAATAAYFSPSQSTQTLPVGILIPSSTVSSSSSLPSYAVAPFVTTGIRDREPMLMLDSTGSMNFATSKTVSTPRMETVREALGLLVSALEGQDSQAAAEHTQGIAADEIGGLRTITFSGHDAVDNGDINSENLGRKWPEIKFQGGTYILPGWQRVQQVFHSEFGQLPLDQQPLVMLVIITDGAALDMKEFVHLLTNQLPSNFLITFALIGYDHEYLKAVAEYTTLAQHHPAQIRVIPFGAETDPSRISDSLLGMLQ